ncbi:hypothetical protein ACTXG5_08330 [Mycobacterium sp. Dal123C01]|uniref:hypothetical protein n=1 Tax=Mycobacterium sp. Dal123C01 TaxID=3457577 RepID=UPI00403ECC7F
MTTPTTLNTKDVAEALGIEPKTLRVFLRSPRGAGLFERDGKAYVFSKADVARIKKAYAAWVADRAAAKASKDDEAKAP